MFHRRPRPASEEVAAVIRVSDPNGGQLTVTETGHPAGGWLGRVGVATERRFRLSTGEPVEHSADDVFVQLESLETLIRQAPIRNIQSEKAEKVSLAGARRDRTICSPIRPK